MSNPYSADNLTEEDWDAILGKYTEEEVDDEDIPEIWDKIKDLEPVDSGNSLHAFHAVFILDGVRYACYWAYSIPSEIPLSMSIQVPRKRMTPEQLDLF